MSPQHPSWGTPGEPPRAHDLRQQSLNGGTGARLLDRRTKLTGLPVLGSAFVLSGMRIFYLQGG